MARHGVLYQPGDYLGFWKRVLISVVDVGVVLVSAVILGMVAEALLGLDPEAENDVLVFAILGIVAVTYLIFLKRSAARTIGYRLFRARIVNLRGETPTVWQMLQRLGFVTFGPGNYIIDLAWIGQEGTKQALRDKWAGTYVIRAEAEPRAEGDVETALHDLLGFSVFFEEVTEHRTDPHDSGKRGSIQAGGAG